MARSVMLARLFSTLILVEANSVDQRQSLQELLKDIDDGHVDLLVIVGGNPVYNTPADLKLDQNRMFKPKLRVHLSQYKDETSTFVIGTFRSRTTLKPGAIRVPTTARSPSFSR
mgnify:CR=1 FL=1